MSGTIKGGVLNPSLSIARDFGADLNKLILRMHIDAKEELRKIFEVTATDSAMDDSITSQARIGLNKLLLKWEGKFSKEAKKLSERMTARTVKNVNVTLGMSLKEASKLVTLKFDATDDRLNEIIKASTQEAAGLIKLIPQKYIGQVQGAAMRSITTGQGLKDLIPFMNEKYKQNARHARLVAYDQTRKAYNSIAAGKAQAVGATEYEWIHSGGGKHPRIDHMEMNGKVYRFDDPPVIDKRTGEKGIPGLAIGCRCTMRPIISFK